jgi:hypothetical protein
MGAGAASSSDGIGHHGQHQVDEGTYSDGGTSQGGGGGTGMSNAIGISDGGGGVGAGGSGTYHYGPGPSLIHQQQQLAAQNGGSVMMGPKGITWADEHGYALYEASCFHCYYRRREDRYFASRFQFFFLSHYCRFIFPTSCITAVAPCTTMQEGAQGGTSAAALCSSARPLRPRRGFSEHSSSYFVLPSDSAC